MGLLPLPLVLLLLLVVVVVVVVVVLVLANCLKRSLLIVGVHRFLKHLRLPERWGLMTDCPYQAPSDTGVYTRTYFGNALNKRTTTPATIKGATDHLCRSRRPPWSAPDPQELHRRSPSVLR